MNDKGYSLSEENYATLNADISDVLRYVESYIGRKLLSINDANAARDLLIKSLNTLLKLETVAESRTADEMLRTHSLDAYHERSLRSD